MSSPGKRFPSSGYGPLERAYDHVLGEFTVRLVEHLDKGTWEDKEELYWFSRLVEEVGELSSALNSRHEHSPDEELLAIATIAATWLVRREAARIEAKEARDE